MLYCRKFCSSRRILLYEFWKSLAMITKILTCSGSKIMEATMPIKSSFAQFSTTKMFAWQVGRAQNRTIAVMSGSPPFRSICSPQFACTKIGSHRFEYKTYHTSQLPLQSAPC